VNKITKDDCNWELAWQEGEPTAWRYFYRGQYVARYSVHGAAHCLGVDFACQSVLEWEAEVLMRLNALSKVQRQALVLGACWPGVVWLAEFKTWRAAWEAAEYTSDMRWLLWQLGLNTDLIAANASPADIRALFPWTQLRAKSLQIWPLPAPRRPVGVFTTGPRRRPRRSHTGFGGLVPGGD
jgi:hypothetical protein